MPEETNTFVLTDEQKEKIANLTASYRLSNFSPRYVDRKALDQMISAHQLKYIDFLIQAEEENKLLEENAADLLAYPESIQVAAIEHAAKAKYDPDYFVRNHVDNELIKPITIVNVIEAKREEAQTKTWKVEYHARLINRLRGFRETAIAVEKNDSFLKKLMFWVK